MWRRWSPFALNGTGHSRSDEKLLSYAGPLTRQTRDRRNNVRFGQADHFLSARAATVHLLCLHCRQMPTVQYRNEPTKAFLDLGSIHQRGGSAITVNVPNDLRAIIVVRP